MKHRAERRPRVPHDLKRGDYRDDFGQRERTHSHDHQPDERRRWDQSGREGWRRGQVSGGFGSQFDAWSSGAGFGPARSADVHHDDHDDHDDQRGRFADDDWQPNRPARGAGVRADDWADEGNRGRGPRGYQRSDERLHEAVCERLTEDRTVDATEITVEVSDAEVTLTGTVPSREQKRRAAMCAEQVAGVHDVFNRLRVSPGAAEGRHSDHRTRW